MFYPELKGPALDAYREMVRTLKAKAMKEMALGPEDIVTRPLRPADLEQDTSTPDYAVGLTALTWTTIVNDVTIDDNRFVGINGFYVVNSGTAALNNENVVNMGQSYPNSPTIEQIRVTRKGSVARYWQVKPIANWEGHTGYCDDPIILDQNTTCKIEGLSRYASSLLGRFDIIGAVVEKRGLLINP